MINTKITHIMASKTSKQIADCPVCCETFTKSQRAVVKCPYCDWECCKQCTRKYLLGTTTTAHCMSCKKKWDRNHCQKSLNNSYYNGEYKNHRKELLFESEKARMPTTMPAVEQYQTIKRLEEEKRKQKQIIQKAKDVLNFEKEKEYYLQNQIYNVKRGKNKSEHKKFIKKCPINGCEGFLSTAWKCGVCNIWVCPDCMIEKGYTKDAEHTCNPDTLASAQLIKQETKPCPTCSAAIYKISGCDQMWCTACNVAFSWKTGMLIKGRIHNPHFYEFQRANNMGAVQNPGAVACGGIPTYYTFRDKVHILRTDTLKHNKIMELHRGATHFQYAILDPMREAIQENNDNQELRIKFIIGEIDETTMKRKLITQDTAFEKKQSMIHIYELMGAVYTESVIHIYNCLSRYQQQEQNKLPIDYKKTNLINDIDENITRIEQVRIYCNIELMKISIIYGQVIKIICDNYETWSVSKKESQKHLQKKSAGKFITKKNKHGRPLRDKSYHYIFEE